MTNNLSNLSRYAVQDRHGVSEIYDWGKTPLCVRRNLEMLSTSGRIEQQTRNDPKPHTLLRIT